MENDFRIRFELYESGTDNNLLELGSYYDNDSVKVYYANGDIIYDRSVGIDGSILLTPYSGKPAESIPLAKDTSEYYFLHLLKNGTDVDTIRLDYRTELYDCNTRQLAFLDFYYNEELVQRFEGPEHSFYVRLEKKN